MSDSLTLAENILLTSSDIHSNDLTKLFNKMLTRSIDFGDVYFQCSQNESWMLEDGIIKEGSFNIERGVGIRAINGDKTGFAYSNDITMPALLSASDAAVTIAKQNQEKQIKIWSPVRHKPLYPGLNPLGTLTEDEKIAILRRADQIARECDPRVTQVIGSLAGVYDVILILNTEGEIAADIRPLVRFNLSVIVEDDGKREQGYAGGGGRYSYEDLIQNQKIEDFAKEAVRQALVNLEAIPAPAGMMPVVLGPGWPGVLFHEAVGHGLEGDFNRKGSSVFSNRIGDKVASAECTVVDDGTLPGRRGSLSIDDEGTASHCTVLIEKGVLKGYMQDRLNAKLMGTKPTGNGRRESYAHLPIPRMTNTYMLGGNRQPEEIISAVNKGLYAVNFSGGQVDITSGKFVFSMSEAYLIENGKITHPVKGAMLIGNGSEVLKGVSMVGNDLQLDHGIGSCGKEGQTVPVGVGQPTLLIDSLTVGGTQN